MIQVDFIGADNGDDALCAGGGGKANRRAEEHLGSWPACSGRCGINDLRSVDTLAEESNPPVDLPQLRLPYW